MIANAQGVCDHGQSWTNAAAGRKKAAVYHVEIINLVDAAV
jgi:hypothetical protein